MFEAYKIGVAIHLTNHVSGALAAMSKDFQHTDEQAALLQKRLDSIKLGLKGGLIAMGAGAAMLFSLKGPLNEAMEWERAAARMRQMGLGNAEIDDAQKFVRATDIMGTSMQERMKLFSEAQGAFRESGMAGPKALDAAKVMMPVLAQYQTAMGLLGGAHQAAHESAMMQLNKTVELMGGLNDPKRAAEIAMGVFKAVQSSGKMVSERDLKQFTVQGGTSVLGLSDRTRFATLEPLMGEFGGSVLGTGMQTAYNRTHGVISKPPRIMVNEMLRMGLWDKDKLEFNSMGGIKQMHGNPMRPELAKLQETDTLKFVEKMLELYKTKGIQSITDMGRENEIIFGRTGGRVYTGMMRQIEVMRRSGEAFDVSKGPDEVNKTEAGGPMMAIAKFHGALSDLGLVIGQTVLPVLTPMITRLTSFFKTLGQHPALVSTLTVGFVALGTALLTLGSVAVLASGVRALGMAAQFGIPLLLRGAGGLLGLGGMAARGLSLLGTGILFVGRALLMNPIGLVITAIAGAAYLLYRNWSTIGPYVMRVWEVIRFAFSAGAAWVGAKATAIWTFIKPAIDGIGTAWTGLVEIVKSGVAAATGFIGAAMSKLWTMLANSPLGKVIGFAVGAAGAAGGFVWDKTKQAAGAVGSAASGAASKLYTDAIASNYAASYSNEGRRGSVVDVGRSAPAAPLAAKGSAIPPSAQQVVQVNTVLNLDSQKVGEAVTRHQAKSMSRPPVGPSTFDGSMQLTPVGAS